MPSAEADFEDVPTIDFADELDKLKDVHAQQFDDDTLIEGYTTEVQGQ